MSTERQHHPYSPSQLSSLRQCPSFEGQQDIIHPRTLIGTAIHDCVETGEDNPELADEDAAIAAQCLEFFNARKEAIGPGAEVLTEIRLSVDSEETSAGFIDAALVNGAGDYAEVLDYKTGRWPVDPAASNPQVKAYVLGLFRYRPSLQTIRAFIFQPTVSDEPTEAVFTRSDMEALHSEVWAIVFPAKAAREAGDFATARPSYPLCGLCKHVGRCPAVAKLAGEVGHKFAPLIVPADVTPASINDPAQVLQAWQLASVVEAWAKSFRQVITDRVICQQAPPPPGYRLEQRSKREIANPAEFKKIALYHLTPEEYESTVSPGLTAVESLISAKAPRGAKTVTVETFANLLEEKGIVIKGEPYSFLKAVPQKKQKQKQDQQPTD